MARVHTRVARKLRMFRSRKKNTKKKPKTFRSEESAKKYAEAKGIKKYKATTNKVIQTPTHQGQIKIS